MDKKYVMHVISGTHWDREWRHTAEQSKPRLVDLIEQMMNILENTPDYKTFCLDGGTVVLEDYYSVRPENRARLEKLIEQGRVTMVNWYTLPDTFTVAPESLIRNLLVGTQMAREYGGGMKSGYTATSYGQTSQLPQIYNGFGIKNAIFYRGTNKHLLKPLFLWEGKDGSKLHTLRTFDEVTRTNWFFYVHQLLVLNKTARSTYHVYRPEEIPAHMCDMEHYERALTLLKEEKGYSKDETSLKKAFEEIVNQAMPYAIGNNILALNMEDNDVPFELLPEMIEALNSVRQDVQIRQSSMDEYMDTIISQSPAEQLPVHHGELRYPGVEPGFNGLLGCTHSSRVKLKILNERAETGLIFKAEPLASFAGALGEEYPTSILHRAWKHLLLNQAHDSICGAAVDQAHEDMLYNFSVADTVGREVAVRSIEKIYKRINTADRFNHNDHLVTLFNTLPWPVEKVHPLVIDLPRYGMDGAVIDPCSGVGGQAADIENFDFVDPQGRKIEYEVLSKDNIQIGVDRELDTKGIKMNTVRRRVLVKAKIPAMGYATVALRPRQPQYVPHPQHGPDRKLIARENGVMENDHLKVTINPNGTFDLLHKPTGHLMPNQHYFTDNGEVGSAHLTMAPQRNSVQSSIGSNARITMLESNILRGIYQIDLEMVIPAGATVDGKDRLRETRVVPITTRLTLEKDCEYLKIKTSLFNEARDHRLRVNFPTHIKSNLAHVESAFAVEERNINWTQHGDNFEGFYEFQPMQNFVDSSDNRMGLAVLNRGLREYEIKDDRERTISITLLRTQRAYMTANTDMTPEEFDKYTGLHSFGTIEYEYALCPHTGNWKSGQMLQKAYTYKCDVPAIQSVAHQNGDLPPSHSFMDIQSEGKLMFSALKQSQDRQGLILRLWNPQEETVPAAIQFHFPIQSVQQVSLDESGSQEIELKEGGIKLEVCKHKIVTLKLIPHP